VFLFGGMYGADAAGEVAFWADGHCPEGLPRAECKADAAGWRELGQLFREAWP
jgi:hypothetical protein